MLVVLGVYSLIAYTVARQTREIGIRMAIGADRGDVLATDDRHGPALAGPRHRDRPGGELRDHAGAGKSAHRGQPQRSVDVCARRRHHRARGIRRELRPRAANDPSGSDGGASTRNLRLRNDETRVASLVSALVISGAATRQRRLDAAAAKLSPCPLRDVRLLDGPFLDAQKRDLDYLLSLQPDRMLHNFRVNAGLAPKAPVYGGWESEEPWVDIRCHGHTLGHYLTAVSLMYASTDDDRMKQRADYIVDRAARVSGAVWKRSRLRVP